MLGVFWEVEHMRLDCKPGGSAWHVSTVRWDLSHYEFPPSRGRLPAAVPDPGHHPQASRF